MNAVEKAKAEGNGWKQSDNPIDYLRRPTDMARAGTQMHDLLDQFAHDTTTTLPASIAE